MDMFLREPGSYHCIPFRSEYGAYTQAMKQLFLQIAH